MALNHEPEAVKIRLSRSQRARLFRRAARLWDQEKPHAAWEVFRYGPPGASVLWPTFRAYALTRARARFLAAMDQATV